MLDDTKIQALADDLRGIVGDLDVSTINEMLADIIKRIFEEMDENRGWSLSLMERLRQEFGEE